jgi:hypothetical protein
MFPLALVLAEMDRDNVQRWDQILLQSLAGLVRNL